MYGTKTMAPLDNRSLGSFMDWYTKLYCTLTPTPTMKTPTEEEILEAKVRENSLFGKIVERLAEHLKN